jgi:hypothetical protein
MMRVYSVIIICLSVFGFSGCQKDVPPKLTLKAEGTYVYSDLTVTPGSSFTVGCIADKAKDDLSLFYVEVAYDGSSASQLTDRFFIGPDFRTRYEKDYVVNVRNISGRERWIFNVNDEEGRISRREIRVTVQP